MMIELSNFKLILIDTLICCQGSDVYTGSGDWYFNSAVFVKQNFMYKVQRLMGSGFKG
jgi:hypothetical protein